MKKTTLTISKSTASPATDIFIIDSLSQNELQSARQRHEDICDKLSEISSTTIEDDRKHVHHLQCKDKKELESAFEKIASQCKRGTLPLLFIDGHGDDQRGLALPSGEFISWKNYLSLLNRVTLATSGELTVVAAFCYSMSIRKILPPGNRLPFAFYYGYTNEISAGLIQTETKLIYESLLKDGGKRLFGILSNLAISLFSEYDHLLEVAGPALMLAWAPKTLAEKLPDMSRGKLRSQFSRDLAANGMPLSGSRKAFDKAVRGPLLVTKLIENLMHNTNRRERCLQEIIEQMDAEKRRSADNS